MKALRILMAALLAALGAASVQARDVVIVETVTVQSVASTHDRSTHAAAHRRKAERRVEARFGPFRVLAENRAALVGPTDETTPAHFEAMLAAFPHIATLEMVECPGTYDDVANLRVARMIRAAALETHVPAGGSVRSGAVELFIAGARRRIDDGAEFAVHSWEDERGREAGDYDLSAPEHIKYIAFYREMGMAEDRARAFYAMTNSVPHEEALWLDAAAMRDWVGESRQPRSEARLVRLDLEPLVN